MSAAAIASRTDVSLIRAIATERGRVLEGEAVGHTGDVVDHPLGQLAGARRKPFRLVHERVDDPLDDFADTAVLRLDPRAEVDAFEHECPEGQHRLPDLIALADGAGPRGCLDEIVDECVDPLRAGCSEDIQLLAGQILLAQQPVTDGVVDVVVDVGDPIDDPHDRALERLGLDRARVREDPVADLVREVQGARDAERLLVMTEAPPEAALHCGVERVLARVTERRVPHVVAEPDRLDEVLVQPQCPARRRARSPSSRACGSCACGNGRPAGR